MAPATLTLATLLFVGGANPADVVHLNNRAFTIPIKIDAERRPLIAQVLLFKASKDGSMWDQVGAVPPDRESFTYFASEDGPFQFKVAVEGKDRRRDPPDIYQAPVGLRIVVDTKPPQIRPLAEKQGDELVVRWELIEAHPDLATLKLEYRTSDSLGGLWKEARIADPLSGAVRVKITEGTPVAVRMQVQDLAQNTSGWIEATVSGGGARSAATPTTPGGLPPLPAAGGIAAAPPSLPAPSDSTGWSPGGPPMGGTATTSLLRTSRSANDANEGTPNTAARREDLPPAGGARPPVLPTVSGSAGVADGAVAAPTTARTGRDGLPPVRMVNRRQITLDYEVAKFGPSGIGSAELYVTRNNGQSWERSGGEENLPVPLSADAKNMPATLKRSLTVTMQSDGPYGFYMVVRSGAGLGKPPPQTGTPPQMRIEVDTKAPDAELYAPEPAPNQRDTLILRWAARDSNLGPTPISLFWSEDRSAWHSIGADLAHNGQHLWRVPPTGVPHRVYLRLLVRDTAGNESIADTAEPVTVDLSEPEVKSLNLGGSRP